MNSNLSPCKQKTIFILTPTSPDGVKKGVLPSFSLNKMMKAKLLDV